MMKVQEVAERLGCSKWFIYKLIRERELTAYKVGRNTRIEENDVEQYLKDNKLGLGE